MITGRQLADLAHSGYLKGQPYSRYDCQGYIKALLKHFGIKKSWLGTNDMWRNHVTNITHITDLNKIPTGAVLFRYDPNKKPPSRYPQNSGDCNHCGLFVSPKEYWHSTTGGVQKGTSFSKWTHWAILKDVSCETFKIWRGEVNMDANRVEVVWKEEDGTIDHEIFDLDDVVDVVEIKAYYEESVG